MRKTHTLSKPLHGALFDMDGTLVDNSAVHVRAFARFCEGYGVTDWQEKLNRAFGMGSDDIMRMILPEEVIQTRGLQALADEKEAIYREIYAPEIRPIEGLRALLDRLRADGVRCAVGSSGCRENIDFVLEKCGIADCFDAIVSGDSVRYCKPHPEIYLTAANKLGLSMEECVVFEDAEAGIEAASRAEAGRIVVISTTLTPDYIRDRTEADRIINDFTEIGSLEELE
ncbi:MAG: HAD family phosphatase [Alistipes sp.]|nr:HAD family phosphatase [Alistipes sp.]